MKYSQIVKELRSASSIEQVYQILRHYRRSYSLTMEQAEYLLGQVNTKQLTEV